MSQDGFAGRLYPSGSNNQQTERDNTSDKIKLRAGPKAAMFLVVKYFLLLQEKRGDQFTNRTEESAFTSGTTRVPQIQGAVQTPSLQTGPPWAVRSSNINNANYKSHSIL